jgi:hypothetical protein
MESVLLLKILCSNQIKVARNAKKDKIKIAKKMKVKQE